MGGDSHPDPARLFPIIRRLFAAFERPGVVGRFVVEAGGDVRVNVAVGRQRIGAVGERARLAQRVNIVADLAGMFRAGAGVFA